MWQKGSRNKVKRGQPEKCSAASEVQPFPAYFVTSCGSATALWECIERQDGGALNA